MSLVVPNAGKAERPIREAGILPPGAAVEARRTGTLLIRVPTPTIDPSGSLFEAQHSAIESSIRTAIALYAWANERAGDLVTIIRSAKG